MLKKLSEDKINEILEAGISEFASHGLTNVSMSAIAKRASISVGVIYKYYADKDAFFLACVKYCIDSMERFVDSITKVECKLMDYARRFVHEGFEYARANPDHLILYHEITCSGNSHLAASLAESIEGMTAKLYTDIVQRAREEGNVRADLDPAYFAMMFDNMIMMMQFSVSCPYYRDRYRLYTGKDICMDEDKLSEQLLLFLESAFTFEGECIIHQEDL